MPMHFFGYRMHEFIEGVKSMILRDAIFRHRMHEFIAPNDDMKTRQMGAKYFSIESWYRRKS